MSLNVLRNFCRVLQISPKHFKISQYESCPVFRGTQLSCWVAFQIEWKRMKNLVNCQQLMFTGMWWHSKFGCNLCKICWEKHPRAFVKVVEGSEIYNFLIHHFVHFYSIFWWNSFANSAKWIRDDAALRHRAVQNTESARAHIVPCGAHRLGVRALLAPLPEAPRAFPRPHTPQDTSKPPRHAPYRPVTNRANARRIVRHSPCACAPT
jgi:hypothetical protein